MMRDASDAERQEMLAKASALLQSALELLDCANAPAEIGARIDHALNDLYTWTGKSAAGSAFTGVERNAEPS